MAKNKAWNKDLIRQAVIEFVKLNGDYPSGDEIFDMGITRRSIIDHFNSLTLLFRSVEKEVQEFLGEVSYLPNAKRPISINEKAIYIISSHQNNCSYNKKFVQSLESLKTHLKAKMIIMPTVYHTRYAEGGKYRGTKLKVNKETGKIKRVRIYEKPKWSAELTDYYLSKPIKLNENLEVCAGVNIEATAHDPVSGLERLTGQASSVFAHAKVRWSYVATPPSEFAKVMMTTGSISNRKYTKTKAGVKGAMHHTIAALVIYVDGNAFWPFIVEADNTGGFYHLDHYYTPSGWEKVTDKGYGLVLGDLHCEWMDPTVKDATWLNKKSLVKSLPITQQVWHDVVDFNVAQSHHNKNNWIYRVALEKAGVHTAEWSLRKTAESVKELLDNSPNTKSVHIIGSNHHDHLSKWINEAKRAEMHVQDRILFHKLCSKIMEDVYIDETNSLHKGDPFKTYFEFTLGEDYLKQLHWPGRNDNFKIYGIDCGQHGDVGLNGARGSLQGFTITSYKITIGHGHTPGVFLNVHQVGHSGFHKRGFNPGYSSWAHVHGLIYPNKTRTPVSIIKGLWRPFVHA